MTLYILSCLYIASVIKSGKSGHKPANRFVEKVKLLYYVRYRLTTLAGLATLVFYNVGNKLGNYNVKWRNILVLLSLRSGNICQYYISGKRAKT